MSANEGIEGMVAKSYRNDGDQVFLKLKQPAVRIMHQTQGFTKRELDGIYHKAIESSFDFHPVELSTCVS